MKSSSCATDHLTGISNAIILMNWTTNRGVLPAIARVVLAREQVKIRRASNKTIPDGIPGAFGEWSGRDKKLVGLQQSLNEVDLHGRDVVHALVLGAAQEPDEVGRCDQSVPLLAHCSTLDQTLGRQQHQNHLHHILR